VNPARSKPRPASQTRTAASQLPGTAAAVAEGFRREAIFVLQKGFVRVERAHLGRGIAIARRGPGDIFGEMSFLEGGGASASVVADEDVEVAIIEGARLNSLLVSVPGLATGFYQSLA